MDVDREKVAYLHDLAVSHFNDGNLAAALDAWKQVLAVDPQNEEALKGIEVAERKLAVADDIARHEAAVADDAPFGGGEQAFDPDSTMVFDASQVPPGPAAPGAAPPAAPSGGFDPDSTVVFQPGEATPPLEPPPAAAPFDGEQTMVVPPPEAGAEEAGGGNGGFDPDSTLMWNPDQAAAAQPPAPPPPKEGADGGGFDPDSTVMWNADAAAAAEKPAPPPAAPAPAEGGFDADSTVVFQPPTEGAAPPEPDSDATMLSAPVAEPDSDATVLSMDQDEANAPEPPAPPPAPPPPPEPAAPETPSGGDLEDFDLPAGGLEMAGPPPADLGEVSLPEPPPAMAGAPPSPPEAPAAGGDAGFSFEMPPPPPSGGAGGGLDIPDLPSLGPPPPPPPVPDAPPPPPSMSAPSGDIGVADPGEVESLAVPTVGPPSPAGEAEEEQTPLTPEQQARRETELKEEYERMYGSGTPAAGGAAEPLPMPGTVEPEASGRGKAILIGIVVFAAFLALGYYGMKFLTPKPEPIVPASQVDQPPEPQYTPAQLRDQMEEALRSAEANLLGGNLDDATRDLERVRGIASDLGIQPPEQMGDLSSGIEFERAYQARFGVAVASFCNEDYPTARLSFLELQGLKPDDPRPGEYIERIYYNAGVQYLQTGEPWEAVWYFGQVLERAPEDEEARQRADFANQFEPGAELGYEYTQTVDALPYRRAGCH